MTRTKMNPFVELLERLAHAEVRFILVGGWAVLLQGHSRTTQDVDILIEASEENARRLIGVLAAWGEGAGAELHLEELTAPQTGALRVIEDFPLDVFTLMRARGIGRDLAYEDLTADALVSRLPDGSTVLVASIPRLLELKAGTGRFKDRVDADALEEILRGSRQRSSVDLTALEVGPTAGENSDQGDWALPPKENP